MNKGCLDPVELRALVAGTATKEAQVLAEQHLSRCSVCQSALELITGTGEEFRAFLSGNGGKPSETIPLLEQAIRDLVHPPKNAARAAAGVLDAPGILQYFSVSQHPNSLGRLGDYEILEIIASGGMGIVLKALDTTLNRIVAIKILAPALASDERGRQRFLREARSAAAIRHDNVVGIFAVSIANDLPFIAMEYIEGESLAHRLQRAGPLPFGEVHRLARETTAGIAAAHDRGIIHRDIKAGNVLIERSTGRVKITDFGLARTVDDTGLTQSGFIAGTPEYLSPEQVAGEPLDARSDLFSLGCLLWAACVGKSPFKASSTLAVLRRVADHVPVSVCTVNPDIPPWFSGIIDRLLAKNPADRFPNAAYCLAAIESGGLAPQRAESALQRPKKLRKEFLRTPWFLGALGGAALIALLLGLSAIGVWQPRRFAVLSAVGKPGAAYRNIERALAAASEGATIELRWDGEVQPGAVTLPRKRLTLRAAEGFHPIWVHQDGAKAGLTAKADLVIEGIEFHYGSQSQDSEPRHDSTARNPEAVGRPPAPEPRNGSLLRIVGAPVKVNRCIFQNNREEAEPCIGITSEGKGQLTILNSGFYLGRGKAIVLRSGAEEGSSLPQQTTVTISNCLLKAGQCIWSGQTPGTKVDLHLERSSFKGGSLLFLPEGGTDALTLDARNNLFASAVLITDQRPANAAPLSARMNWIDHDNLFAASDRLIASDWLPGGGPRRIDRWPFSSSIGEGSRQVEVRFARSSKGKGEFRMVDAPNLKGSGSIISKTDLARFGAHLETVGPAPAPSAGAR